MNLINKIFNRKIAGDTSNIVLPDATGIDNGIEYKSAVNSNVPNGLFNHISDAIQYLQFSVGLYSNTAQYTEGNICKVITKENGHYQIRVFRRNGNNSGSTTANPPIPTTPTTTNGISCYPVENETEWNTDWDECETGLAYWEFKIEGKTITEAVQSFDNRNSVGATWTKASIQELYDSVKNFRVVYFYNCLITTNNIEKVGNIIKGSFSFENIARYTMRFEYNLDASSFTSCSYNVFNYNSSIKELNSDALYNSVKGNILKVARFENISLPIDKGNTSFNITIKQLLNLPANVSVQGFSLQHKRGKIGDRDNEDMGMTSIEVPTNNSVVYRFQSSYNGVLMTVVYSILTNITSITNYFNIGLGDFVVIKEGDSYYRRTRTTPVEFIGDTLEFKAGLSGVITSNLNIDYISTVSISINTAIFDMVVYYYEH